MVKARGTGYFLAFILKDLIGNQLRGPINGHTKELLFWEKQIAGFGQSADKFQRLLYLDRQHEVFPADLRPMISELMAGREGRPVDALDVGSGVISVLISAHNNGQINLVASDILADKYKELLSAYGFGFSCGNVEYVQCAAEGLKERLKDRLFDFVHCKNALDHTEDPIASLENMVSLTREGGYIIISGYSREGTAENWDGIHNHDLFIDSGKLYRSGKSEPPICITDRLPIETIVSNEPKGLFDDMFIAFRKT